MLCGNYSSSFRLPDSLMMVKHFTVFFLANDFEPDERGGSFRNGKIKLEVVASSFSLAN